MPTDTQATQDEKVTLAAFARRNREKGNPEEIRIEAGHFQGYIYTHFRTFYDANGEWRPTKQGVALREQELDAAIEALQQVKAMVLEAGRTTSPDASPPRGRGNSAPTHGQPRRLGARYEQPPPRARTSASGGNRRDVPPWENIPASGEGGFDEF